MSQSLTPLALLLLGIAAWRDIATRTIPDRISLALAALGLLGRLPEGAMGIAASLGTALALLLALVPLHAGRVIGGGDVKLLVALACGLPPLDSARMLVATALVGGGLGLLYLALRPAMPAPRPAAAGAPLLGRVLAAEAWRIRHGGPLPYAVAIAAGASLVLLQKGS